MQETLGVGVIGASAERGWAKVSHIPAVRALTGLELVAVASGSQTKADAAAKEFGATAGYADGRELINDPNVDIVAIAVKVPDHRDLVLAAVAARKHIYCEWPLGRNLAETEELAAAAQAAGVHGAIGLQTRANAVAKRAQELLSSGVLGRVLSTRVLSTTVAFGKSVEAEMAFAEEPDNGVTLVTIQGAHTIDLTLAVLGGYDYVNALATTQFPDIKVANARQKQARLTPDHLLLMAHLSQGGALSVEVAGGRPHNSITFSLEVTGETGVLTLEGGAIRGFQSGRLRLRLNGETQQVEEVVEVGSLPETAANVAGIYAALRDDIHDGSLTAPDFQHAVRLTRLMDAVMSSSNEGNRLMGADWPRG